MDIVKIQSLIAQGKLVKLEDIDPSKSYVQLGVYQAGNRQKGAANANTYAPYAIALDELKGLMDSDQCGGPLPFKPGSVGPKVSFKKDNYSDPHVHKDVIIPGVLEITRGIYGGGIYNIAQESSYNNGTSPFNTEWNNQYVDPENTSWGSLWNLGSRTFTNWYNSVQTPEGNHAPPQQVGMHIVMRELTTNRLWLIMFTEWSANGSGGGFAYDRYEIYPEVVYTRDDYEDNAVDKISDGVWIARKSNGHPLYNAVSETSSQVGLSPVNTRWNSIYTDSRPGYSDFTDLSNLESRVYTDFALALDYNVGSNILGTNLVMHDLTTDLYWLFKFNSWTPNANGGGFSYTRTVVPQSCAVKFADGSIMNTAKTSGSGSTCCPVIDADGNTIIDNTADNTVNVPASAGHLIDNFSGMLIVNDHYDGGVELWIAGGGDAVMVSRTTAAPGNSTLTIIGNGYKWTNVDGLTGPFTFTVVKTRNGS